MPIPTAALTALQRFIACSSDADPSASEPAAAGGMMEDAGEAAQALLCHALILQCFVDRQIWGVLMCGMPSSGSLLLLACIVVPSDE